MLNGKLKEEEIEPNIDGLEFYVSAFYELGTERNSGMGLAPIPFTSIVKFATIFKVEDFEEFHYIIRSMDTALLESEKTKDGNNNGNKKNSSSGRLPIKTNNGKGR